MSLCLLIFTGGDSFIFLKGPDKVAQIIEAVPVCNLRDRIVGGRELITCLLDPLVVQVIHRCLVCHLREEPTKVFR